MHTDEHSAPVLPIYQQLLDEVDPGTRDTVIAVVGTQQDSRRPGASTA